MGNWTNDFLSGNPAGVLGEMYRGTVVVPLSAALSLHVYTTIYIMSIEER